jgi:hypothetical protein
MTLPAEQVWPASVYASTPADKLRLAQQVAQSVRTRHYAYDRNIVAAFQHSADLSPIDGLYGARTRDAVRAAGVHNPPVPLFRAGPR